MGIKRVPLLLVQVLLLVAVSSGQNTGTEGTKEEIPEGASTLAFVFDVTGSMYDDLVQVIEGASKILEMSQSRTKRPLYNYALVPFHDPEIGPVTITTDPKKFQFELRELYVQGGGDCPEMSIGAIKIALEISLPGSFIYVFTDARSKDYKLTQEVLQLIQQKQSQVVFVLTGDCDDRAHIGYKVYEEIASTSSGQVFHLDKKQVNEVLKWVEEAVQSSKVHLLSTDHYNGVSNTWPIPFDPSLKEVTVALSGPAPDIEIRNPQGRPLDGLTELLHIPNSARVVNIKDPEPGMWSIKTSSEGRHSVRISGVSTIDFRAGFSRKPTLDFKMTSSRPVQGIATYILLNTTGLSHPARADRLELVSITGGVIKTLPVRYYPNTGTGSPLTGTIWNITEFVPPKEAFFLRVTGYDKDGFLFQRVSSVSFSSIVPGQLPGLTVVLSVAKGSGQVVHYIRNLGGSQESANALWDLAQVTLTDEGFYECIAISNAGTGHARTFLDPPPAITVGGNVTATPGSSAVLTCHVASTVQFNLTWHRGGVDARLDPRRRPLANLSLDINSIGPDDAGWYECVATNEGGVSIERIYLIVQEPPQVSVDPRHQTFTTGQEVRIRCSARGYPAPHLVWTHNDILPLSYSHPLVSCLLPESPVVIVVLSEILIGLGETTILACSASGIPQPEIRWFKGKILVLLTLTSDLCLPAAPQFTREPSDVAADIGSNVTLPCHVQGYPEPQITWRREDNAPIFTRHLWVEDETVYVCEAQNQFGRIQTHARITVTGLVSPVIGHSPGVLNVIKEQQVTLPCVLLAGNPLPERRWLHNHGLVSSSPYVTVRRDGSLHIEHVRLEEGGEYTCLAENVLGSSNRTTTLNIYAGPRVLKVQVEHPVDLPCVARGVPQPFLAWLKDGAALVVDGTHYRTSLDGSLTLGQVGLSDQGTYTCLATSIAGRDQANVQLQVQGESLIPPVVDVLEPPFNSPHQERVANQRIAFPCPAKGTPTPVIKWLRNGQELTGNEPGLTIMEDGTLLILASVSQLDNGEYVCTAANEAGTTQKKYQLKVNVPPDLRDNGSPGNVSVVLNQPTNLVCDVTGSPVPVITWYKDGVPVGELILHSYTGSYSCKAINIAGSTEKDFLLEVLVPPTIVGTGSPRDVSAVLNQEISLDCKVKGTPFPTIQWYKDRKLVFLGDPNIEVSNKGQTLKIKSARLGDQAHYQCSVTNAAGKQTKDFNLSVYVPPTIKGGNVTSEVTTLLDNVVMLECEARGVPLPAITWYRNGEAILSSYQAQYVDRGHFLRIPRAQASDTGQFSCRVTSVAGTAEKNFELDVYLPPSIKGGQDTATERKVVLTKPLNLECEVGGHPPPTLTWLKDGVPVRNGESINILEQGRKIEILSASVSDAGRYVCVATSVAGEKEINYDVSVLVPPVVEGGEEVTDTTVIINNLLELECRATGTPSPILTQGEGVRVTANGRRLVISRPQVSDTARFQCVATNEAGDHKRDFNVAVHGIHTAVFLETPHQPPVCSQWHPSPQHHLAQRWPPCGHRPGAPEGTGHDSTSPFEDRFHEHLDTVFTCLFLSVSMRSAITWYKDGRPLTSAAGVTILKRGQLLEIDRAQLSDAGLYRCIAVNVAGTSELSHRLQVYGNRPAPQHLCVYVCVCAYVSVCATVNLCVCVFLTCVRVCVSPPLSAQVSDTGKYTCVAVNAGGEQQREYDLRVYVPPNIMGEEVNATVMLGRSVELRCQSDAIPPPTLSWRKDGRPLFRKPGLTVSEDGSVLKVRAQVQDSGRYTCEATNIAGKTEKNYNLNVWGPAVPSSTPIPQALYLLTSVTIKTLADGVPRPAVTWLKDGRPITGQRGAQVLNEGRLLQIKDAKVSDTGRYTCVAVNVAGQADSKHDVNTQVPENVSVVVNNPVALTCEASGIPLPAITWLKDGRPIRASSSRLELNQVLTCLSGGRNLRLMHAAVEDAGRYSCIVSNTAGEERKNFDLDILVPPSIVDEGTVQDAKVKEKHNVTLTCEVAGNPVPEITWLKDGQSLGTDRRHQVLSHGRYLQISGAQVDDTGRYSCLTHNRAGDRSRHFNLNVLVSPTIVGSGPEGSAEEVTVTLSSPTSLVCEVQSYPPALITWLKDGTPLESSHNVRVLPGGRTLQILNAKEEDAGRYTCVATNEAGDSLKNYEVKVYIPPQINKNDVPGEGLAPKEVKIKVNNTLTLECEAQAIPTPSLQWYKDGQVNDHVTINANGRTVRIKHAQVSDTGRYTCVATNIAGEDEKDFDINIQVPPSFQRPGGVGDTTSTPGTGGDVKDVVLNNPISLYCETNAVPPPTLTWYKDGRPMASNENVLIMPGGRVLQIPRAQAEDSGRYTCLAVNEAGEDSIQYDVRVLVPPSIRGVDRDLPEEMVIQVNKTTVLECQADGSPTPKITWLKDSQPISLKGPHRLLQVVCFLSPPVPPTIVGASPENVTVVVNNFVSLTCEATGFPPPSLSWVKDRGPVQANTNALIMPGNTYAFYIIYLNPQITLQITLVSQHLMGILIKYQITVEKDSNISKHTDIWTLFRMVTESANLRILAQGQMLELKGAEVRDTEGRSDPIDRGGVRGREAMRCDVIGWVETISNPVTFACDATGIPHPSLIWLKNGRTIESLELHILSGGSKLQIARSQLSDSGTYTCMASNVEGKARKSYHLTIQVPPSISGSEMPSEVGVLLNDSVQLVCRSQGTPPPSIQWLKDGKALKAGSRGLRISLDGSTLTVSGAHTSDSGKYTCVATNKAGEEDRIFNLNVYVPPVIKGNSDTAVDLTTVLDSSINIECVAVGYPPPQLNWLKNGLTVMLSALAVPPSLDGVGSKEDVTVVRGNLASLLCIADGTPSPSMSWMREGEALVPGPHVKLLNVGTTVQIIQARVEDTGRYTCVARNSAGQASRHFHLKVLDPPRINGSGVAAEVSVVVNHVLELLCEATGIPAPTLTWMKDGRPLPQTDSLRDTGRYTCLANSPAGDDDKDFLVRVHVPPNIAGESTPQNVSVLQNRQVTLECKSDAVPPPALTWLKDGKPLQVNNTPVLCINMAELGDGAQYTCVASNIAVGPKMCVCAFSVAPTIAEGPLTVAVHIDQPVVLECIVSGVPAPRVTWRKHGAILAGTNPRYMFAEDGSLHVPSAQVTDTGRYLCMATNQAGTQRKRVDLQVHVPPSISRGPTNITVTVNVQTTLSCEATGIPKPTVSWTKNGQTLNTDHNQNMYRLLSSGSLVVIAPTVEDTAEYECVVSNEAGEEARAIQLTVQVPPSIADEATELVVSRLSPLVIGCTASGVPEPMLHWSKDGMKLPKEGNSYSILSSGAIEITSSELTHSGRYSCVAKNAAGSAHRHVQLTVQVPPVISSQTQSYLVTLDSSVTMLCQAEGSPSPSMAWHKDGQPLSESVRQRVLSSGSLQIAFAQPGDTGRYTCTAANAAGQDSQTVRLSVHTQPAFTELLADMALNKGERLVMACGVTGIPPPKITWAFNNIIIPGMPRTPSPSPTRLRKKRNSHYDHVNGHSELVIERVTKDNSGTYSCIAENRVGTIKSLGFVYVKEPPIIDGDFHSNRIEPLGGNAILNCEVRGDPLPTIQWSKKGVNIQISNRIHQLDNGSLAIYGTVNEDAGNYMCVATNDAGVVEKSVTLTLQSSPSITVEPVETVVDAGTTVLLNCRAEGEPTPVIEWSRQGSPLLGNERFTTLSNGSLRLTSAQKEDTAEYQCVARNLLGSVLVRVTLTVRGGPQKARGSIIGNINNVEFGIAVLNATISDNQSGGRVIHATISNVPRSLGPAMRKLISILNSIYWTTAQELGEAMNGYSLTRGVFRRETQVEFATGEILRMTHVARGLDSDGALLLDIVLNGHILQLPSNDYTEDYIQTGPGQLYALSTRMFSIDRVSVPYSWNHTITYDPAKGKMPYLVETLHASAISAHYRPLEEVLEYKLHATITKDCYCLCYDSDEDECKERSPCSHVCHNAMGTYYCSCPRGLTISADGRTCQDIDECSLGGHMCHDGQDCENTIGSYRCVMRCGRGFRRTADGHSCQDIDECRDGTHQCRYNQICENSRGSYHCTCPRGYRSQGVGRPCVDSNECEHAPQPCAHQCLNTPGSFKCVCPPGRHLLGDGKSCAGLEKLPPSYQSFSYAWPLRATPPTLPQGGAIGSVDAGRPWPVRRDINECEVRDTCQHECMNTPGSHRCQCPAGYRLMTNGKTCQDIDECLEQNVQCGTNRMCFNMRGSYQCIDTPCPPNYQRDPATGFCLKKCPPNDLECALSPYALEYKLLSLPFGIAANQDLIRLVAYTQDGVVHPRTSFLVVDEDVALPFALRDENLKGVLFTTRALREPHTFRMKVRSLSYSADGGIEYQTTFIVYIAVSAYPY
uniref:Hemicentin 1 n=1 Tax=Oncorhynchus tshawytscha TaxID=74940 RepID=A0AAZ3SJS1_ONCTS